MGTSTETGGGEVMGLFPVCSARIVAMLRAVSCGRAEMTCSSEPDLFIDGIACCDQYAAHELSRRALIRPALVGARGTRVPALLTAKGADMLEEGSRAA